MKEKLKVSILLGAEFLAIAIILLLIFFAGKKSYTVTFDLNGGTLIAGDLEQRVTQGHDANPPQVTKEGHYFLRWSGSYSKVTSDTTLKAIWEYETTPGIIYADSEFSNYTEIVGAFKGLRGEVYIGAYQDKKKVLGIGEKAFADLTDVTAFYLLDGVLRIENSAFQGCTNLEIIDLPDTTTYIGEYAFANCESLTELVLPTDLEIIAPYAFQNCTSLERIVIPENVKTIGEGAFQGCSSLVEIVIPDGVEVIGTGAFDAEDATIYVCTDKATAELTLAEDWCHESATVVWGLEAIDFKNELEKQNATDATNDKSKQ